MSAYGDESENTGTNPSTETHFDVLLERCLSRRNVLVGGLATTAAFLGAAALGSGAPVQAAPGRSGAAVGRAGAGLLGYTAVPLGYGDDVVVPPGYTATPFLPWGTPILGSFPAFRPGVNTAAEQEQQIGMHHDGMHFFPSAPGPAGRVPFPPPGAAWAGRALPSAEAPRKATVVARPPTRTFRRDRRRSTMTSKCVSVDGLVPVFSDSSP